MSDKKRSYQKPDIRFHDQPRDLDGVAVLELKLDSIDVSEWHPLPHGQGKPGPGTLDAFISALAVHRFHVWPDQEAPTR